jgi:hypothetical protein
MPLPTKTYYLLREPKICALRDIGIHIIYDSALGALQRIIDNIPAISEVEIWGIAVDQSGYISTEWLIYSYSRTSNKVYKHSSAGLSREKENAREPTVKQTMHVMDISAQWDDVPAMEFSISY